MSTVTIPGLFKRKGIWTYRRVIMPRHLAPNNASQWISRWLSTLDA